MNRPVSGNISISQEVLNYRGEEKKRLCLQKTNEGSWEVQFIKPEEANAPSWYDAHHGFRGVLTRVQEVFLRHMASQDTILLDINIGVRATESGSQFVYDLSAPRNRITNIHEPIDRDNTSRHIFRLLNLYDNQTNICTTETHQTIQTLVRDSIAQEQILQEATKPILRLNVEREKVNSDPMSILHQIHEKLKAREENAPRLTILSVYYKGETGADFGGVSAELISDLIRVLTNPSNKENLKGFELLEGGMPSLTSDEGKEGLIALGALLGFCITNEAYHIGPTFDENFYNLMSHLPPPPINTSDPKVLREAYLALNSEDKLVQYLHTPFEDLHVEKWEKKRCRTSPIFCLASWRHSK